MTPLERARARLGHVTPAGQPIAAQPEGGGLAVPDEAVKPEVGDRDLKPYKVTQRPSPLLELAAAAGTIDEALTHAGHVAGAAVPRTPLTASAEQHLDETARALEAGKATRDQFTAAVERYVGAWLAAVRSRR
jgi:hypothetical protein